MTHSTPPPGRQGGRKELARAGGFTLIELITVIVILGILALVATSGSGTLGGAELARMAEVRAQIRFVQLRAMKTGAFYGLSFSATDYWAFNGTDPTNAAAFLTLPGESNSTISLAGKGITAMALPTAPPYTVYFNGFGIPFSGTTPTQLVNPAAITITVGGASGTLTITPETGYVP